MYSRDTGRGSSREGGVEAAPRLWSPGVVFQRPNGEVLAAACDEAPPPSY